MKGEEVGEGEQMAYQSAPMVYSPKDKCMNRLTMQLIACVSCACTFVLSGADLVVLIWTSNTQNHIHKTKAKCLDFFFFCRLSDST